MEKCRLVRDGKHLPLNIDAVEPRPEDCCVNCLRNVNRNVYVDIVEVILFINVVQCLILSIEKYMI